MSKKIRITRTAQIQNAKEQFIGKCDNCKTVNQLYDFEVIGTPKYCEECGNPTTYQKTACLKAKITITNGLELIKQLAIIKSLENQLELEKEKLSEIIQVRI